MTAEVSPRRGRANRLGRGGVLELDGFLDPAEAASAYSLLRDSEIPSSLFYVALAALAAPGAAASLARYLPQGLAAFVVSYLGRLLDAAPDDLRRRAHGFELWTTRPSLSDAGQVYLHIDCDEKLRTSTGVVRAPLLGSVLFLGPKAGLVGGETLFVTDERPGEPFRPYRWHDCAALVARPDAVRVVVHHPGKLTLFAGDLRHGQGPVVDHPEGQPRIALLANLWDGPIGHVPEGPCALSPEAYRSRQAARGCP